MSRTPGPPDDVVEATAAALGARARRAIALGPLTTYRVGGAAALFFRVESEEDLRLLTEVVGRTGVDVLIVGKGSNLLVADAGFPGLAVALGDAFADVDVDVARVEGDPRDRVAVRAGGAAALPVVARRTASAGLTGFEWAVGVPGSVGGAVRMNAGGHGSDMAASLRAVRLVNLARGEDGVMPVARLDLRYRGSALTPADVVVWAELALTPGDQDKAEAEVASIVRWRRANQPGGQNAGSVFTNPPGDSAGRLVDAAGCKGLRLGSAAVSDKHANFIQADAGGSADDVLALMVEIRRRVAASTGVLLEPETRLVGFATDAFAESRD